MSVHYLFNLMSSEVLNFCHNFKRKRHDTSDMMIFFMFSLRLSSCYIFSSLCPAKQQSVLKRKSSEKYTVHCRDACQDPDNLNRLAIPLVVAPYSCSGGLEFESPAVQSLVRLQKVEDPWGQVFYNK